MGRRSLLQSSTYPDVTGHWRQANVTGGDLQWARLNLVRDSSGVTEFERGKEFIRHQGRVPPAGNIMPPTLSPRVYFIQDELHPRILIRTTTGTYKLRELAEQARLQRDPTLAPHVNFRVLAHGNDAVAFGFLKEFGPLNLPTMQREELCWVDLNDFWLRQARFAAVVRLYESLQSEAKLREAFAQLAKNLESLNTVGPAAVGYLPDSDPKIKYLKMVRILAPQDYLAKDQRGEGRYPHQLLRADAINLISCELTLHTEGGLGSSWIPAETGDLVVFRPERVILSLWAGIWELFGLDTWTGMIWRACRICGKYFYPLQVNSDCCTPEHQSVWSKREYARRSREKTKAELGHPARKKKGA